MESRKRPRAEDVDLMQSKKRAVSDNRDSSAPMNGMPDSSEPKDGDSLEVNRRFQLGCETWAVESLSSCSERMRSIDR